MTEKQITQIIEKAIEDLFAHQPKIFKLTAASKESEWNLANHLAPEIGKFFEGYNYDAELIKPDAQNRRPDIIIHERETHARNLLVIELKRENVKGMAADKEKIKRYWFAEPYVYQFGATINLNSDHTYQTDVFTNPVHARNAV